MNLELALEKVHEDWLPFINDHKEELEKIFENISEKINNEETEIFPYNKDIFRSLFYFGPKDVKIVLLGQDPYINSEVHNNVKIPQACGLSFSVPKIHKKIPPSLKNIFLELKNCYPESFVEREIPKHGSLKRWVKKEKILLLNAALTVLEGKSNSHQKLWMNFTDSLIRYISDTNEGTIFLLMGNFAIGKSKLISNKHKIFTCVHPSPLSAYNGFFGCGVFKQIDEYLESKGLDKIVWIK